MALATTAIAAIMIISLFYALSTVPAAAASFTYTPNNVTVGGVLATDSYVLFPWVEKSLTIGFSKYGEMIDTNTNTGLNYAGLTDPFSPFGTLIAPYQMIEGWVLNITYNSPAGYGNVWAFALHSDYYNSTSVGGNWIEGVKGGSANLAYLGGRKTNGGAVTAPIQVLYNGPRSFTAMLNTTIYTTPSHDLPLVELIFIIEFDKVTKQVTILKDIKRIDYGKDYGVMQIEFGDRGEWDLGPAPSSGPHTGIPFSSANIFENLSTSYNPEYQSWYQKAPKNYDGTYDLVQILSNSTPQYLGWAAFWPKPMVTSVAATEGTGKITRPQILTSTSTHTDDFTASATGTQTTFTTTLVPSAYPQSNGSSVIPWEPDPLVFLNGVQYSTNGTTSPPSNETTYYATSHTVKFPTAVPAGADVKLVYIVSEHGAVYDKMAVTWGSPFVIGEWAFLMDAPGEIFRGVTVYGVAERSDGTNKPPSASSAVLDSQAEYFLNSTFNPYDLTTAVEKDDSRWVNFFSGDGVTTTFKLTWNYTTDGMLEEAPLFSGTGYNTYYTHTDWDEYANNVSNEAERVLVDGVLAAPTTPSTAWWQSGFTWNYTMSFNSATDTMSIVFTTPPPAGTDNIEVKYTTDGKHYLAYYGSGNSQNVAETGQYEWIVVGSKAATVDSLGAAYVTEAFDSIKNIDVLKAGMDFRDTAFGPNVPWVSAYLGAGNATNIRANYYDSIGRSYLADNWCPPPGSSFTEPITSSQMIFVGGPRANLGEEYFNEFTNAFFAEKEYVVNNTLGQANEIFASTCWHLNTYTDNSTTGYGMISVSEDLNGTVGLVFWGLSGQDTYYVTQWFWNYPYGIPLPPGSYSAEKPPASGIVYSGIQYLQHEDDGVTSIILQINYACHTSVIGGHTYHFDASNPEITIAHNERLGTISEKGQHDP
jgi:hypothetical protein